MIQWWSCNGYYLIGNGGSICNHVMQCQQVSVIVQSQEPGAGIPSFYLADADGDDDDGDVVVMILDADKSDAVKVMMMISNSDKKNGDDDDE